MRNFRIEDWILYEDKEILVCHKPAGIAVQSAGFGTMDMESALKNYLAGKGAQGIPYVAVLHRLDQPVEGAIAFAKTPRAAGELSRQIANLCNSYHRPLPSSKMYFSMKLPPFFVIIVRLPLFLTLHPISAPFRPVPAGKLPPVSCPPVPGQWPV